MGAVEAGARRSQLVDLVLVAGAAVAVVAVTANIPPTGAERELDALAYALMVVATLALAGRRRHPLVVLAVVSVVLVVYTRRTYPGGPIYLALAVALFSLALHARRRRDALVPAAVAVAFLLAGGTVGLGDVEWTWHLAVFPGWAAAALFLGDASRSRRQYLAGLEERARSLEESREEEARRRVAEERLRIARDLHDVVAHTIATINLRSGVAAHVVERRPEEAVAALTAIRRASATALQELRATLDVLRSDGDDAAPRVPTPGLDRVEELAGTAAGAGIDVSVERVGVDAPLPAAIDVAAYRIVQESLTNVMRHAGATRATVVIRSTPGALDLEVVDDGRGASAVDGEGHGIAGMRERASLVGGRLEAGPNPGGGYRVRAHLPTGGGRGEVPA